MPHARYTPDLRAARRITRYPSVIGSSRGLLATVHKVGAAVAILGPTFVIWSPPSQVTGIPAPLLDVASKPIRQVDWPNPVRLKPKSGDLTWLSSGNSAAYLTYQHLGYSTGGGGPSFDIFTPPAQVTGTPYPLSFAADVRPTVPNDWPNPRGYAPLNRGFTQESLAIDFAADVRPISQYDWPVPRGHGPRQAWSDSFKLPLTTVVPPSIQQDWPVPRGKKPVVADWDHSFPLPLTTHRPPFIQRDWPNPRGKAPTLWRGHTYSFQLPLTGLSRLGQLDRANPVLRRPFNLSWQSTRFLGFGDKPVSQDDWPNPRGARRPVADWVVSAPYTLISAVVATPFNQSIWPVPQGYTPGISLRTWTDSFKLTLTTVRPPSINLDWPNPTLAKNRHPDWVQGWPRTFEAFVNTPPVGLERNWPNPRGPRRGPQDFLFRNSITLQDVVPLQPITGLKVLKRSLMVSTTGPNIVLGYPFPPPTEPPVIPPPKSVRATVSGRTIRSSTSVRWGRGRVTGRRTKVRVTDP